MGELEKAYGAALSKTKRGAFKQAAVAGVIGLGGVYIAKEKYKKRKEAAERMLNFQTSVNPLLTQKKTLFNRGLKWWDDHYAMLEKYNQQDNETGYKIALQNKLKDEYLNTLQVKETELDPSILAQDVSDMYKERLKGYEEQKKLFSDFSHYRETYTPEEGRKKYLAPIRRDIARIEKNIAKDSNLGRSLFKKLLGEKDPIMLDMPTTGGYGKINFIKVDSTSIDNQSAANLIQTINADQNKLGQSDLLKKYFMFNEALLNPITRDRILTGESVVDDRVIRNFSKSKLKSNTDTQENLKLYNSYKEEAVYGRSQGKSFNKAIQNDAILNRKFNNEGIFRTPNFDKTFGDAGSQPATYNQVFKRINILFESNEDFMNTIGKNYDSARDFFEQMHEGAVEIANILEDNMESSRTTAGKIVKEEGLVFGQNRYYEAAFQTMIDNAFKEVPTDPNKAQAFIRGLNTGENLITTQETLLNNARQNFVTTTYTKELEENLKIKHSFKIVNKNNIETKTLTGRQFLDFIKNYTLSEIKNIKNLKEQENIIRNIGARFKDDNKDLFEENLHLSESYNRTFLNMLKDLENSESSNLRDYSRLGILR